MTKEGTTSNLEFKFLGPKDVITGSAHIEDVEITASRAVKTELPGPENASPLSCDFVESLKFRMQDVDCLESVVTFGQALSEAPPTDKIPLKDWAFIRQQKALLKTTKLPDGRVIIVLLGLPPHDHIVMTLVYDPEKLHSKEGQRTDNKESKDVTHTNTEVPKSTSAPKKAQKH